jgi:hypothetical protein
VIIVKSIPVTQPKPPVIHKRIVKIVKSVQPQSSPTFQPPVLSPPSLSRPKSVLPQETPKPSLSRPKSVLSQETPKPLLSRPISVLSQETPKPSKPIYTEFSYVSSDGRNWEKASPLQMEAFKLFIEYGTNTRGLRFKKLNDDLSEFIDGEGHRFLIKVVYPRYGDYIESMVILPKEHGLTHLTIKLMLIENLWNRLVIMKIVLPKYVYRILPAVGLQ